MKQCQLTGNSHGEGLCSWMRQSGSSDWVSEQKEYVFVPLVLVTIPVEVDKRRRQRGA
jgi:hypothetical protein